MTMRVTQLTLENAEDLIDHALDNILRSRDELMEAGLSAYTFGIINSRLADTIGELHKVRRLMPGYRKSTRKSREEGE